MRLIALSVARQSTGPFRSGHSDSASVDRPGSTPRLTRRQPEHGLPRGVRLAAEGSGPHLEVFVDTIHVDTGDRFVGVVADERDRYSPHLGEGDLEVASLASCGKSMPFVLGGVAGDGYRVLSIVAAKSAARVLSVSGR